jgi:hypothetical protein
MEITAKDSKSINRNAPNEIEIDDNRRRSSAALDWGSGTVVGMAARFGWFQFRDGIGIENNPTTCSC